MGTVSDLVAEIQQSFDVDPADALTVLDRRHKQMCDRARWRRLGLILTTIGGPPNSTSFLQIPDDVVEIYTVQLQTDPTTDSFAVYSRTRFADSPAILNGTLQLCGPGGVFYELPNGTTSDPEGTSEMALVLYPAVAFGTTATVDAAVVPTTLTTAETSGSVVRIPADFHDALLAGVYATLLNRPNEARPDLAGQQEALFSAGCDELRDRANRRYRTKGPRQIRTQFDS